MDKVKDMLTECNSVKVDEDDEWVDLVNEKGEVIGKEHRSRVHGNPELLHPVVHVHVFNQDNELYLQKRAAHKRVQPGKWDTAVGGHISSGEELETALFREVSEELNIKGFEYEYLYNYIWRSDFESEFVHTFMVIHNGPIDVNQEEISEGKFWAVKDIEAEIATGIFTPNFLEEFRRLKETGI